MVGWKKENWKIGAPCSGLTNKDSVERASMRRYLEALWLLGADDEVLWRYRHPHRTKPGFSYVVVLLDNSPSLYENVNDDDGGSSIGANLAARLWIFSKAVRNNWSPAFVEEKSMRNISDMS